ncbi:MAG: Spy/CpxP family protein refolding chaperone [Pyrinomonadaceae bacterium]
MFSQGSLPVALMLILTAGAVAFAQESQTPQTPVTTQTPSPERGMRPERMREGRRHDRMQRTDRIGRPGFGRLGGFHELNLTEEQRQQQRAIVQRHVEGIKAQREELFKMREKRIAGTFTADDEARVRALRQEIHNSMRGMHTEVESLITAEQRTRLEQLKSEHKARREEMLKRRQERRENIPQ